MLTTTIDGLWVLQAVTGVEQTCPELGLRPLLPRLDTPERALRHPMAAELHGRRRARRGRQRRPDDSRMAHGTVAARPGAAGEHECTGPRATRGPFADSPPGGWSWNATATWYVFIPPARPATRRRPANWWWVRSSGCAAWRRRRRCDRSPWIPSSCWSRCVTRPACGRFCSASVSTSTNCRSSPWPPIPRAPRTRPSWRCRPASGRSETARVAVGDSTVAIVDTPAGRVCVADVVSGQRRYQVLSPGSRSDIVGAVQRLIRRLPAGRRVVLISAGGLTGRGRSD